MPSFAAASAPPSPQTRYCSSRYAYARIYDISSQLYVSMYMPVYTRVESDILALERQRWESGCGTCCLLACCSPTAAALRS